MVGIAGARLGAHSLGKEVHAAGAVLVKAHLLEHLINADLV